MARSECLLIYYRIERTPPQQNPYKAEFANYIPMNKLGIVLIAMMILLVPINAIANSEYTITIIILREPVLVSVQFPNGTVLTVGNDSVIRFTSYVIVTAFVPNGYDLYVNGKNYGFEYNAKISTNETLYLEAIPIFDRVTINIIGNGQIEVQLGNGTTLTLDHSASFQVLNKSFITITSNKLFDVNNDDVYTKFYGAEIIRNTTLNINFNLQTPPPANINLKIYGQGALNVAIENISATGVFYACLALYTFNKSAAFYAPINTTLWLFSNTEFEVNGQLANKTGTVYSYYYYVNGSATLNVTFTNVTITQITTSPPPATTVTQTTTTVTITSTPTMTSTTTATSSSVSSTIYIVVGIVIVIIALLVYFILRRRR